MPMRRRRDHASFQGRARQFDLFVSAPAGNDPLLWVTLPEETRQAVTSLMARLILERGRPARRPPRPEATDDI
jgi:hypothetical protein